MATQTKPESAAPRPSAAVLAKSFDTASAKASSGDLDGAWELIGQILEADPRHVSALDLAGFVLFLKGRYAEAQACCERSLDVSPNNAYAMKGWGLCVAKQGRVGEGLESLERAIAAAPDWFDPCWDFLVVCGQNGRAEDARPMLRQALKRFPDRAEELQNLARSFNF